MRLWGEALQPCLQPQLAEAATLCAQVDLDLAAPPERTLLADHDQQQGGGGIGGGDIDGGDELGGGIGGFGGFSGFGGVAAAAAAGGDRGTESRSTRLCPAAAVRALPCGSERRHAVRGGGRELQYVRCVSSAAAAGGP